MDIYTERKRLISFFGQIFLLIAPYFYKTNVSVRVCTIIRAKKLFIKGYSANVLEINKSNTDNRILLNKQEKGNINNSVKQSYKNETDKTT